MIGPFYYKRAAQPLATTVRPILDELGAGVISFRTLRLLQRCLLFALDSLFPCFAFVFSHVRTKKNTS